MVPVRAVLLMSAFAAMLGWTIGQTLGLAGIAGYLAVGLVVCVARRRT